MSDFLPIGLGRDGAGNVSHFQEITSSDSIPENYLQVSNNSPKWNASGLQGYSVSTTVPTNGYVLTWDSTLSAWKPAAPGGAGNNAGYLNGIEICTGIPSAGQFLVYDAATSSWCPSTYVPPAGGGGVTGVGVADRIVKWTDSTSIGDAGFSVNLPLADGRILEFDLATTALIDSNYGRGDAGWNANKIQGVSASPTAPSDGQVWVYDAGSSSWTPSTLVLTGGGGAGTIDGNGTAGRLAVWTGLSTLANWSPSIGDEQILEWDTTSNVPISTGYKRTDAAWNANKIQGVSASPPVVADHNKVLTYLSAGEFVLSPKISQAEAVSILGDLQGGGSQTQLVVGVSGGGGTFVVSGLPTGSFLVTSGNTVVPAYLPAYLLRYFGTNTSSFPQAMGPAESSNAEGQLLYYDATNQRWTNTLNLKVDTGSNLSVANVSSTGTIRAVTLSSTNYLNLPSSTIVWASAGYATLAGSATSSFTAENATSATSALNAQQAPAGFIVTGTMSAGTVSATNYINLPSSTIVWASAGYATLAGSATSSLIAENATSSTSALIATNATSATTALNATSSTSALNAQQAPNNFSVTGNVSATSTIQAATLSATNYLNLPSATLEWYQAQQSEAVVKYVKNQTGATLAKGTAVTVTGVAGDTPLVANLSSVNTHVPEAAGFANHVFGLVQASIAHDAFGYVVTEGAVEGTGGDSLNTAAFAAGDTLYVSSNGQLSNVRPPAPYEAHPVGYVVRVHANTGIIYTKVETTPEINDIVGFNLASSLINGDLISYDTTTSTFKNVQAINVSGQGKFGSVSATTVSAGEAIYVDGGTGYIVNPAGSISLSAVGGTVSTNVTTNIANGSGNIFLRAGRAGIYTDTAASAYYIAPNNYADPRVNFVVAQTSAGDSYLGAKSGQSISFVVPSNTLSSITTANRLMQIEASGINVRTGIVSTSSIIANTVSATTYLNLPSGTITWTNATSATSALNARQAPAGFDVTGMLTAASGDVSSTRLTDYSEKKSAPTISSSALTLDLNNSQVFTVALNSNISTLTISNPDPRSNTAQGFTLILTADGTARTITWPASVKWPSATGPTLTSTNNKVDILSFLSPDNGTTWYGFIGGQNF